MFKARVWIEVPQDLQLETVRFEGYIEIDSVRRTVHLYDSEDLTVVIVPLERIVMIQYDMPEHRRQEILKKIESE